MAPTLRLWANVAGVLAIGALGHRGNLGMPLKRQWPWYHSSQELRDSFQALADGCSGAELTLTSVSKMNSQEAAGQEVQLDVVRVRRKGAMPRTKALLVFGEHARELITTEAALALSQALCGKGPSTPIAAEVLAEVEFVLVPNANPLGRKEVERGYYCKRTNEDGVDLNRNWSDEHRSALPLGDEMYPGTTGFSEPETQLLRELIDQEQPEIYLSVHSGAFLLGMPYGYTSEGPVKDQEAMLEVLRPISEKFCGGECPVGNLANLIHYENPGCDIDYVYNKLKTPYVFTWEIFSGQEIRERYIEEAKMQRQDSLLSLNSRMDRNLRRHGSGSSRAASWAQGPEAEEEVKSCMDQFNPQTEAETTAVAENWAGAFLALSAEVAASRRNSEGAQGPKEGDGSLS